ncbi:MAG: lipoyl(octanoyl) transferase LipB [Mycobacteriales bacterium]
MDDLTFLRAGRVPYEVAWAWQRQLATSRADGEIGDVCLLLEHDPVYTAGKRTTPLERPSDGTPVIDVDRGGKITWHGPGQLTGYPIVSLQPAVDVVAYVRRLEDALIAVCADLGIGAGRVEGRSGVWSAGSAAAKVGAIGVRVVRGVTLHGFGLNCDADLSAFDRIVPCGITDAGVTSLSRLARRVITVDDVLPLAERHLARTFGKHRVEGSPGDYGLALAHA